MVKVKALLFCSCSSNCVYISWFFVVKILVHVMLFLLVKISCFIMVKVEALLFCSCSFNCVYISCFIVVKVKQ